MADGAGRPVDRVCGGEAGSRGEHFGRRDRLLRGRRGGYGRRAGDRRRGRRRPGRCVLRPVATRSLRRRARRGSARRRRGGGGGGGGRGGRGCRRTTGWRAGGGRGGGADGGRGPGCGLDRRRRLPLPGRRLDERDDRLRPDRPAREADPHQGGIRHPGQSDGVRSTAEPPPAASTGIDEDRG
ncbi:hypothetical protein CA850_09415 [Micromonospora echinospora]|nr:hypothetical protein CA850_09415 [Micromonospora echinospora]